MSRTESAHLFPEVHAALGINLGELGCIMANVPPIDVVGVMDRGGVRDPQRDLYTSEHPDRFWIRGAVGEKGAHVTLLYGLLEPGPVWSEHVDALLADVPIIGAGALRVHHVEAFDSPYPDEPYKCIVAVLDLDPFGPLAKAHGRLSYLPHVDTFPAYRPHVTLAYVKDEPTTLRWARTVPEAWVRALNQELEGATLQVTGIDYGGRP